MRPLSGIKVLDLSRLLPGPYATLVLADLGATVDQVEEPSGGGDSLRMVPPFVGETGGMYYALHRNKRSLALNLKSDVGKQTFKRLISKYDVLVESFRPGVMDNLGLGYSSLSAENPRLIYCAISGYGQTGPDRLKAGHDLNYLARSGFLATRQTGIPRGQAADVGGGSFVALIGILTALYERQRTRRGRFIDVSMAESSLAFSFLSIASSFASKQSAQETESVADLLYGDFPGYRIYRTADGRFLAVAALEPKFFARLCEALNRPDWAVGVYESRERQQAIASELETLFQSQTFAYWTNLLASFDVCVEPLAENHELEQDPQFQSRALFVSCLDDSLKQEMKHLRTPFPWGMAPFVPPPALGQNGNEILSEAGFSEEERLKIISEAGVQ